MADDSTVCDDFTQTQLQVHFSLQNTQTHTIESKCSAGAFWTPQRLDNTGIQQTVWCPVMGRIVTASETHFSSLIAYVCETFQKLTTSDLTTVSWYYTTVVEVWLSFLVKLMYDHELSHKSVKHLQTNIWNVSNTTNYL